MAPPIRAALLADAAAAIIPFSDQLLPPHTIIVSWSVDPALSNVAECSVLDSRQINLQNQKLDILRYS